MKGYLHWQILVPYVNMHGIDRSVKPAVIMIVDGGHMKILTAKRLPTSMLQSITFRNTILMLLAFVFNTSRC